MHKLLFSISILLTLNAFGQAPSNGSPQDPSNGSPNQQRMNGPTFIVAVQMGTDTLKNGEVTVNLKDETLMEMKQAMASPDYTVILTPRGTCGSLNLFKISPDNFIVKALKGSGASDGIFDYVVFVKQHRPMMPMHPHPPQPPAPPAQPAAPQQQQ